MTTRTPTVKKLSEQLQVVKAQLDDLSWQMEELERQLAVLVTDIQTVEQASCEVYRLPVYALEGRTRISARARRAVWWVAHDKLGLSYDEIATLQGAGKTAIISGVRVIRKDPDELDTAKQVFKLAISRGIVPSSAS